jgi:hypothetical protein
MPRGKPISIMLSDPTYPTPRLMNFDDASGMYDYVEVVNGILRCTNAGSPYQIITAKNYNNLGCGWVYDVFPVCIMRI